MVELMPCSVSGCSGYFDFTTSTVRKECSQFSGFFKWDYLAYSNLGQPIEFQSSHQVLHLPGPNQKYHSPLPGWKTNTTILLVAFHYIFLSNSKDSGSQRFVPETLRGSYYLINIMVELVNGSIPLPYWL